MKKNSNIMSMSDYITKKDFVKTLCVKERQPRSNINQIILTKSENMDIEISIDIDSEGDLSIFYDHVNVAYISVKEGAIPVFNLCNEDVEYLESRGVLIRDINGERYV